MTNADADQTLYLSIAYDLFTSGTYSNGLIGDHSPGAWIPPLSPALPAGLMHIDPILTETARCVTMTPPNAAPCPAKFGRLIPVQTLVAIATILLIWLATLRLHPDPRIAWVS